MSKNLVYYSKCVEAASKSPMLFTLGCVIVKGGKVLSSGHNHHRTHYDCSNQSAARLNGISLPIPISPGPIHMPNNNNLKAAHLLDANTGPGAVNYDVQRGTSGVIVGGGGGESKLMNRKPLSMHAEMHAIYELLGRSPTFKQQFVPSSPAASYSHSQSTSSSTSTSRTRKRTRKSKSKSKPQLQPAPASLAGLKSSVQASHFSRAHQKRSTQPRAKSIKPRVLS